MPGAPPEADGEWVPLVSVVIASVTGPRAIAACLRALLSREGDADFEVIVVDRRGGATRDAIRELRSGRVCLVPAGEGTPISGLRATGLARARGQVVAVLEDHCNVAPGWLRAVEKAREAGRAAVGGVVENGATGRLVDWAAFFCEYGRFLPPVEAGPVLEIPGNNAVYDRRLVVGLLPEIEGEIWEGRLHRRLLEMGEELHCDPDLRVVHDRPFGLREFLGQRYHYSRAFAAARLAGAPGWRRGAYAVATVVLPPVLFGRIVSRVWRKGRYRGILLRSLPLLALFTIPWAWGEAVGALLGPGDSPSRVE